MPIDQQVLDALLKNIRFRALGGKIAILPDNKEAVTPGGIILAEASQEKPLRGMIVAVGPGRLLDNGTRQKPDVAVGEVVIYGKYSGSEVKVDGQTFMIVDEDSLHLAMTD